MFVLCLVSCDGGPTSIEYSKYDSSSSDSTTNDVTSSTETSISNTSDSEISYIGLNKEELENAAKQIVDASKGGLPVYGDYFKMGLSSKTTLKLPNVGSKASTINEAKINLQIDDFDSFVYYEVNNTNQASSNSNVVYSYIKDNAYYKAENSNNNKTYTVKTEDVKTEYDNYKSTIIINYNNAKEQNAKLLNTIEEMEKNENTISIASSSSGKGNLLIVAKYLAETSFTVAGNEQKYSGINTETVQFDNYFYKSKSNETELTSQSGFALGQAISYVYDYSSFSPTYPDLTQYIKE